MEQVAQAVIMTLLASSGMWSLVLYFFQRKDKRKEQERAMHIERILKIEHRVGEIESHIKLQDKAEIALMHHSIYEACSDILTQYNEGKRKCIDIDELHDISVMYDAYAAMGGNGTCKIMYDNMKTLPLKQTNRP